MPVSPDEESLFVSRAEYERLEKRLQRERDARLEAEAIAERGLAELWGRQRELELIKTIAKAANQARTSRSALGIALKEICDFTQWPVGHVYLAKPSRSGMVMAPTRIWRGAEDERYAAFREASETLRFAPGEGLPGRVLELAKPSWISPLKDDHGFTRRAAANAAGLLTGLAFPVMVGSRVAAVLEFFSSQLLEPDERLLAVMAKLGDQLGRGIEREQAERQLRAKNRELLNVVRQAEEQRRAAEAANQAKTTFLAVTSHEVRTPLNAVLGLAEGLRREPLNPHQASLVEGIQDSGSMLLRLLNAVLELSRIEAGEVALTESPVNLRELLASTLRLWRGRAEELSVSLTLDAAGLPDDCIVQADEGKLEQILTNLISNALKFSPAGGRVQVTVAGRHIEDRLDVTITVEDDGPGVPTDERSRIFEPYAQTEVGRASGGAGLGLAICSGHVRMMGGTIGVGSSASGGAAFQLELALPWSEAGVIVEASEEEPEIGGLRVLIAEDNEPNRRVMQVLLAPAGVDIVFAENGQEALEAIQRQAFDLVLMDAQMPVMSGAEAVGRIRRLASDAARTPIHMLTANAFESDVQAYMQAGADGVLAKPVDVPALYRLLGQVAAGAENAQGRPAAALG